MAHVLVSVGETSSRGDFDHVLRECRSHGLHVIAAGRELSAIVGNIDDDDVDALYGITGVINVEKMDDRRYSEIAR